MKTRVKAVSQYHYNELQHESRAASCKYNELCDKDIYKAAVEGESAEYANQLIDAALAQCGDPYFVRVFIEDLDYKAMRFLVLFL